MSLSLFIILKNYFKYTEMVSFYFLFLPSYRNWTIRWTITLKQDKQRFQIYYPFMQFFFLFFFTPFFSYIYRDSLRYCSKLAIIKPTFSATNRCYFEGLLYFSCILFCFDFFFVMVFLFIWFFLWYDELGQLKTILFWLVILWFWGEF